MIAYLLIDRTFFFFNSLGSALKIASIYLTITLGLLMDCPGVSSNTYGMLLLGHLWRANDETARRCLPDVTGSGLMSPSIMVLSTSKYENTEAAIQRCSLCEGFALKICSKFTGEHICRSMISISNFIEITLRHGWSPVNLLRIFRTLFLKNISGQLLPRIIVLL